MLARTNSQRDVAAGAIVNTPAAGAPDGVPFPRSLIRMSCARTLPEGVDGVNKASATVLSRIARRGAALVSLRAS